MTIVEDDLAGRMHETARLDVPQGIHGGLVDCSYGGESQLETVVWLAVYSKTGVEDGESVEPDRRVGLQALHLLPAGQTELLRAGLWPGLYVGDVVILLGTTVSHLHYMARVAKAKKDLLKTLKHSIIVINAELNDTKDDSELTKNQTSETK